MRLSLRMAVMMAVRIARSGFWGGIREQREVDNVSERTLKMADRACFGLSQAASFLFGTRRMARVFTWLVLKIQKFAYHCIFSIL